MNPVGHTHNFSDFFNRSKQIRICALLLAIIFLLKGILYAIYIVPPSMGSAPDDIGHMSYIKYIVNERSIPLLNTSTIDEVLLNSYFDIKDHIFNDLVLDSTFKNTSTINWIAQHPPLYYLLMGIPFQAGALFTNRLSIIIIAIRVFTTLFGVLTLFFIYKLIILLRIDFWVGNCILIFFTFFSPIQYYFSNVTNDSLLIFLSTCALFFLLDYIINFNLKSFLFFALSASFIVITKYTGIILLIPLILYFSYKELKYNGLLSFAKLSFVGILIGTVIAGPWFIRNYLFFNKIFPLYEDTVKSLNVNISLVKFLTSVGYLDELIWHMHGLMGGVRLVRAHIVLRSFITFIISTAACCSISKISSTAKQIFFGLAAIILIAIQLVVYNFSFITSLSTTSSIIIFLIPAVVAEEKNREVCLLFVSLIMFYFAIFMLQHRSAYIYYGVKRAIQGRYYYPLFFPGAYMIFDQFSNKSIIFKKILSCFLLLSLIVLEVLFIYQMIFKFE